MAGKKQQTFAKLQRERKVKERRQLKQEKKQAAKARKLEAANGDPGDAGDPMWVGVEEDRDDADDPTTAIPSPAE